MKKISELNLNEFTLLVKIYTKEYSLSMDREVELISLFFDIPIEEVEELEIAEYNKKVKAIAEYPQDETSSDAYYTFSHEGNDYNVILDANGDHKVKVKDKRLIELYIKKNPEKYLSYIAAIIFSNGDFSEEAIETRADLFSNHMSSKYLSYHLNKLGIK